MTNNLNESASRHAIYTQRFAGHLANLFDPYSERLKRELRLIMLDAPETTQNIRRINQIVREYRGISLALYGDYNEEQILTELSSFAASESEFAVTNLKSVVKSASVEITAPASAQVWAAVNSAPLIMPSTGGVNILEPFIKEMEAIQIKKVSDLIRIGFMTGRTNVQITKDIAGKNGYLDKQNRAKIKTMVRTATNHVSNIARQKTYEENDDIVIGYEILATLDGRTSDICRGYDGLVVKHKDKVKPMPPFHPNCRTTTSPVLDARFTADDEAGTRASAGVTGGKQVDANKSYYQWLKDQGATGKHGRAFVTDVLGKERADLFLNGGLTIDKFKQLTMDELFRPLPLKDLRKKESLQMAFDRID
jgi:SPP1 gp7 family putative phage head morphogenesis protein